jgi:adenylate kinase
VRLVIMGAPGAGKGTQATRLGSAFGVPHVSTGDMLRAAVANGSPLGAQARKTMERGLLIPDELMVGLVKERLATPDCRPGFILDGFPRTVAQARSLDAVLADSGAALDAVLHVQVPRDELVRRLVGRRVCRGCGAVTYVAANDLAQLPPCARCGGDLHQRDDDREATIRRRMDVYARETEPVLAYYRAEGRLRDVSGTGTPDEVFARIQAEVG